MIIIVGAGVAGLIAGLQLLNKGYEVKIFEKNAGIKSTACGEGCDLQSLNFLPFDSRPYVAKKVEGIKFNFMDMYFYAKAKGVVLNRQKWMEAMAEKFIARGGKIEFSTKVIKIDDEFIYLQDGRRIAYDICIGADGPSSTIKNYFGNKYEYLIGCQYEIEYDTSNMNFLEFYINKSYTPYYAWIFPKDGSINVGLAGKFSKLNDFLKAKGIRGKILKKSAGIVPVGMAKRIADDRIALIGDAASLTNPFSLGGISPIIYASKILVKNINNLRNYEKEIKKHEICDRILLKGHLSAKKIKNEEVAEIFSRINGKEVREIRYKDFAPLILKPFTLIKMRYIAKAFLHSLKWGW
ncbi:hypothetical protein B6U81_01270 [Thermoplasmatales archaeon ex4484_30]|nr:MAG: NAD(P)/FAD-dependent oxidoreductase [Thermoplasmata archaeon]OYT62220.1 MAG: hypothetical protein B6U81_01270 [Thermoplasmatales archaeon ex4484_30]